MIKPNIGIWIDAKKAMIVSIAGEKAKLEVIESTISKKEREEGEGKDISRFGNQFIDHKKSRDNKYQQDIKAFAKNVLMNIEDDCNELVIFGPANMKLELKKEIELHPNFSGKVRDVQSAESMTDNQVIAWVKQFYKVLN